MNEERTALSLENLFKQRRETFLKSLEHAITVVSSDQLIQQLFKDKHSTSYIPDRICDTVLQCITDDREDFITELFSKLRNIEACFGPKLSLEIEEIGRRLLNLPSDSFDKINSRQKCLQRLQKQLINIQEEHFDKSSLLAHKQTNAKEREIRQVQRKAASLKESVTSLANNFEFFNNEMHKVFRRAKRFTTTLSRNPNAETAPNDNKLNNNLFLIKNELESLKQENMTLKTLVQIQRNMEDIEQEKDAEIQKLKRELNESKSKIDDLTDENENSKRNLKKTLTEINKIKALTEADDDNKNNSDAFSYIKQLQIENKNSKSEIIKIKSENQSLLNENNDFKSKSTQLSNSFSKSQQDLNQKTEVVDKLDFENQKLKTINTQLLDVSKNLQQQNREALEQISKLKSDNLDLKTKLRNMKDIEELNSSLQNQISEISILNNSAKSEAKVFKEKTAKELQKLKSQNQELSNENEKIETQLNSSKISSKSLQNEFEKVTNLNSSLKTENAELKSKIQTIENKLNSLENERNLSQSQLSTLQNRNAQIENENSTLRNENQELKMLNEESLNNCAELKEAAEALSSINSKLTVQNSEFHSMNEVSKIDKKLSQSLKDNVQKYQEDLMESALTISKLRQENSVLKNANKEVLNLKEFNEKLEIENKEMKNGIQQMKSDIVNLENNLNEKEKKISSLNSENSKINTKLLETEDKLDSLKSACGLIGSKSDQLVNLLQKNDELQQSLKTAESQISKINENNAVLINNLTKSKKKNHIYKNDNKELISQIENLIKENNNLKEIKKRVNRQLNDVKFSESSSSLNEEDFESRIRSPKSNSSDIYKIPETISRIKTENRHLMKISKKLNKFHSMVCKICNAKSDEVEAYIENLIKQHNDDLIIIKRIRDFLKIGENENIVASIQSNCAKIEQMIKNEKQIRKALHLSFDNDNNNDIYHQCLMLRAKADNNEKATIQKDDKNSSLLNRIISLLQIDSNNFSVSSTRIPLAIQSIQAQINDDRILFKQLRNLLDINNDNEILNTLQSLILTQKETQDALEKIKNKFGSNNDPQELLSKIYDTKVKASILEDIKKSMKIYNDDEVQNNIMKLISIQNQINSSVTNLNDNNSSNIQLNYDKGDSDVSTKIKQIQDNDNILRQLGFILKVEQKNDIPINVQNLQNYSVQMCQILGVDSLNDLIPTLNKVINENSLIDELKTKLYEKDQKVHQMQISMESLESQVAEISRLMDEKRAQTEASNDEKTNLLSSLKSKSYKIESMDSKLNKKNNLISSLKKNLISLKTENKNINDDREKLSLELQELQSHIESIVNELKIDSFEQIPDIFDDLKKQLSTFSKVPFTNEAELKRTDTFRNCLKEISSLLISTDIQNYAKEIEEIKYQNSEFTKVKNHLSFALSLKLNESLTGKVDEVLKEANESRLIFSKLCQILDVPNKEEVVPKVDSIIRENSEMKSHEKMLQNAASVNSQQTLLNTIKAMKQKFSNFTEKFDLNDESEVELLSEIMKQNHSNTIKELSQKIKAMRDATSTLGDCLKQFNIKSVKEIPSIVKIVDNFSDISLILETNNANLSSSKQNHKNKNIQEDPGKTKQKVIELVKIRNNLTKLVNSNDLIQSFSDLLKFRKEICSKLNVKDINQIDRFISKFNEITQEQNDICQLLGIEKRSQILEEITNLQLIARTNKKLIKLLNVQESAATTSQQQQLLVDVILQLTQEAKTSQKMCRMLNADDETQLKLQVQKYIKNEKKICKLLNVNDSVMIKTKISSLMKTNEKLSEIYSTNDIINVSQNLINSLNRIYHSLKLNDNNNSYNNSSSFSFTSNNNNLQELEKIIVKLDNDYKTAMTFFSRIFIILSGQNDPSKEVTSASAIVHFPISVDFEQKMINLVTKYKKQNDECQILLSKASSVGYKGDNVVDASDFMLNNLKNQENSNNHIQIKKVTDNLQFEIQKVVKESELEKLQLKNIINQLKQRNSDLSENEEKLVKKIKSEKKKRLSANNSYLKEKDVNESLISIIHGNSPMINSDSIRVRSTSNDTI